MKMENLFGEKISLQDVAYIQSLFTVILEFVAYAYRSNRKFIGEGGGEGSVENNSYGCIVISI